MIAQIATVWLLVMCNLCCEASETRPALVDVLDRLLIPSIHTPEAEFQDAAFNIEAKLTTTLYAAEMLKGSSALAKQVRVLIGTMREGKHAIVKEAISVRGYLQEFATQWAVAVLIQGDTIMIVEAHDVKRFENEVAILPQSRQ